MIALADQSTATPWPTWALFVLAVAGIVIALLPYPRKRTPQPIAPTDTPRCHLRCGLAGTITRTERADLGGQVVNVCPGHSDEGSIKGWWSA